MLNGNVDNAALFVLDLYDALKLSLINFTEHICIVTHITICPFVLLSSLPRHNGFTCNLSLNLNLRLLISYYTDFKKRKREPFPGLFVIIWRLIKAESDCDVSGEEQLARAAARTPAGQAFIS